MEGMSLHVGGTLNLDMLGILHGILPECRFTPTSGA